MWEFHALKNPTKKNPLPNLLELELYRSKTQTKLKENRIIKKKKNLEL